MYFLKRKGSLVVDVLKYKCFDFEYDRILDGAYTKQGLLLNLQLWHKPNQCATHHLLPSAPLILCQRADLEEPLARARHEGAPLMRQIHKLAHAEPMHQIIRQDSRVGELGLAHHLHRARVVQEQVMHQAAPPGAHAVRPTVPHIAHQRVAAAVKVQAIVVRAQPVLARPVNLKIREKHAVKRRQHRELVRVLVHAPQVLAVLGQRARLVPALRHARVVLPRVEQRQVRRVRVVERHHAELLAQVRHVPAVDGAAGPRLGRPPRVPHERRARVVGEDVRERRRGLGCVRGAGRVGGHPHGARAKGRARALPEGGAQEHQLVGRAEVVAVAERVVDGEHGGAQLGGERGAVGAGEGEAEEFLVGPDREQHVDEEPGLGQRGGGFTVPGEGGGWRAAGSRPWCVV